VTIAWTDGQRWLRIPPHDIRSGLPPEAARVYACLDRIADHLGTLFDKYEQRSRLVRSGMRIPGLDRFYLEMDNIIRNAAPRGAVGW